MANVSKYPRTVSQEISSAYVKWDNLENIKKNVENAHAISHEMIKGKSSMTKFAPSPITASNFGFNLPEGAEPTKIIVTYRYRKVAGNDYSAKYPKRIGNLPAPYISLINRNDVIDPDTTRKGVAPTLTMTTYTKEYKVDGLFSRADVNSGSFGVFFDFRGNTNQYDFYMRFAFVRVSVEYRPASFGVSVKKLGGSGFNGDDYTVELSISNKNRTNYNPTLTLTSPLGFSFKRKDKGNGIVTQVNARTFRWNPQLNKKVGSSSVELVFGTDVTFPTGSDSYTGTFSLSESLNGTSNSHIAIIREKPPSEEDETQTSTDKEIIPDNPLVDYKVLLSTEEDKEYLTLNSLDLYGRLQRELEYKNTELYFVTVQSTEDVKLETSDGTVYDITGATPTRYGGVVIGIMDKPYTDTTSYPNYQVSNLLTEQLKFYSLNPERTKIYIGLWDLSLLNILNYNNANYQSMIESAFTDPTLKNYTSLLNHTDFIVDFVPSEETVDSFQPPFLTLLSLGDEELDRLGTGYSYIVQSYLKHETDDEFIRDWYKNNRVGVFNNAIPDNITVETVEVDGELVDIVTDTTDYENLTPLDIYENADYWSNNTAGLNDYENVECDFTYNHEYPLYIIITGDYPESLDYGFDDGALTYTEPAIIEKTVYTKWQPNGNYPTPIKNLILNDGSTAETGIPTLNTTDTIIIYDYPLDEDYGNTENRSIRGLEVTGTIEQSDELVLYATLTNPDGIKGQRSVIINDENTTLDNDTRFKLGGLGDLWGFSQNDLHNLEDWELGISIQNLLTDTDTNINFGDIQLTIYTEDLEKQLINVKVNGEDLTFYGAFIENVNIPSGLETDTSFLTIDGTDTNDAYRQNIREKTIELELTIGECDLQTSTDMLRQLTKLLVNDKDRYNRPIPNIIEFSHYPDVYFEYIMKDSLDVDSEIGAYNIKAKLTIPSGTAYSKQSTTTNITGYVQGIAAINPTITFKPQTETITITESVSGQVFHMAYAGDWQSKVIEIDCEDRRVYVKEDEDDTTGIDITKYVDFDVDWFSLHGEYAFTGTGCVIRTVNFVERW